MTIEGFAQSGEALNSVVAKSPTETELIAEWSLNARGDRLRVAIDFYHGKPILNCRRWWLGNDGELRPRKAGVSLSVKHLPRLIEALQSAQRRAIERRLLRPNEDGGARPLGAAAGAA
jgi:hypothetical protein